MKRYIIAALLLVWSFNFAIAQTFTTEDYKKAAWMTLRFYGGQRSSQKSLQGPNWLIMDHAVSSTDQSNLSGKGFSSSSYRKGYDFTNDADGSTDLSGGWFDCGDHVKFGQTEFYAAYVVLKGFSEWPAGYNDYYSYDYSGYQAAGDFTWEGGKGTPNGIPDVLDEVKYACEFFIKCTPSSSTFYSQVGDGSADHKNWVTSVAMAALPKNQGGQSDGSRTVTKNPSDCAMPSFCAATLALFSKVYAKYDPEFAATCLEHAKYAYAYAKSNKGKSVGADGNFYPAHKNPYDAYVCACAEMYWATGDNTYKTEATSNSGNINDHNWQFGYNNCDDLAAYNLLKLGDTSCLELLEKFINSYYKGKANSAGVYQSSDNWGTLRYNGNAAFIVALYNTYKKSTTVDSFIYSNIDYILGNNSEKLSYVVGFTPSSGSYSSFQHPHHRNVYLTDDINAAQQNLDIPTRNKQFGFLAGGKGYNPSTLANAATQDYEITEGGIDYNAGLTSALAYIVSMTSPVDTNKFGHPTADLGPEKTLCGTGSATITATVDESNLDAGETYTIKWYKDGTVMSANQGKTSITVTAAGTYTCELVSNNDWTTSSKVVVSATLPDVEIGDDAELCKVTSATYSTDVEGTGITYAWYKDNKLISGATSNSYTAYSAGTYKLTVSAAGCTSKSAEATVTSSLPEVIGDTICAAGAASLAVTSDGDYEWYSVAEEGTALASGSTYTPNITKTTTYYVQDAGSINFTAGPKASSLSGTPVNWGEIAAQFTTYASLQITSIDIYIQSVYNSGSQTFTATLAGTASGTFTTKATVSSTGFMTLSFENDPIVISTPGSYSLTIKPSNAAVGFYEKGSAYTTYQGDQSVILFTGASNGTASNYPFPGLINWVVNSGSSCARTPVFAVLDPDYENCAGDTEAPTTPGTITVSDITASSATISWTASTDNEAVTGYDVYVNDALYETVTSGTSLSMSDLTENTEYTVKVRAFDAAGNTSAFNTEKSFTTEAATVKQTITLASGWNLISFYTIPDDATIASVFGSAISKISIIKNNDGFYKPGKDAKLQSLTEIKAGEAYLVKATGAVSFSVEGTVPTSTTITLKAGWNLLGYPKATESQAQTTLSSIWSKVSELKDLESTQTTLTPGKGYYINIKSATSVTIE